MYIVNTSFVVDNSVHDRWMGLMVNHYLPFLGKAEIGNITFTKVLTNDTVDGATYSLQVEVDDIPSYKVLTDDLFNEYLNVASDLFADKVLYFTSLLKRVEY